MKHLFIILLIALSTSVYSQKLSVQDSARIDSVNKLLSKADYTNENIAAAVTLAKSRLSFTDYPKAESYFAFFVQLMQEAWLIENSKKKK